MIEDLKLHVTVKGKSGKGYKFKLFEFERNDFDKLCELFSEKESGVYIFLKIRFIRETNEYKHKNIYCGESANLPHRLYKHNKKNDILREGSNCFGIFLCNETEDIEKDILLNHDFKCNDQNN